MVNAAKHSGATRVDVYVEVDPDLVFGLRPRSGTGFDLAHVDADPAWASAASIVERMKRTGGRAIIRTAPDEGARLELPQ